jgi:hypothetical protein
MNSKWPALILVAFMALASTIFFHVVNSHEKRIAACENILMKGERGTDARGKRE